MRSFARRGYAATSLRGIAAEAGVTAPLVSYYFKSKEGLFLRLVEIVMESLEADVAERVHSEMPFPDAISAIVSAHTDLLEQSPSAIAFMLSLLYGPQEGQPIPDIDAMWANTGRLIEATFERGIANGEFVPRPGVSVPFLVEQLGSLIHDYVIRRFRCERHLKRYPEKRDEIERRAREMSLEVALEHFFFGAGRVPALAKE